VLSDIAWHVCALATLFKLCPLSKFPHPQSGNAKVSALVDGCLDKLSHDSGRRKISNLNDTWAEAGHSLQVAAIAAEFQLIEREIISWNLAEASTTCSLCPAPLPWAK